MPVSLLQVYGPSGAPSTQPYSGPLAPLDQNKYTHSLLQYPRDLASTTKSHVVKFEFFDIDTNSSSQVGQNLIDLGSAIGTAVVQTSNTGDAVSAIGKAVGQSLTPQAFNTGGAVNNGAYTFGPPVQSSASTTIALYMPDSLEFSYQSNYNDSETIASAALALGGGLAKSITSGEGTLGKIGSSISDIASGATSAAKIGLQASGYVFNPQQQLLFQGIGFRSFPMTFTFTPYSVDEAQTIQKIITAFRKQAAPTIVTGSLGFFFNPPGLVDISFLYNGTVNPNINKINRCVIESVDVNYAPNGWAAHQNGEPVQTTMTVNFKEIALVDSALIDQGY